MQLQLATTRILNGNELACYVEDKPADEFDFWASREQIGTFLGYRNPRKAIKDIHIRNKERLDKFSRVVPLSNPSKRGAQNEPPFGNVQTATVYSFKGILEICRFSNQPIANRVIDIMWDVADEIRRKGYYMSPKAAVCLANAIQEREALRSENVELKKYIQDNHSFTMLGQAVTIVNGYLSVGEAAKLFKQYGIDIGQNRLFAFLRDVHILCKRKGIQYNQPTQKAIEQGLCRIGINIGSKGTPYITTKGLKFLADHFAEDFYPLIALIERGDALHE